MATMNFTEFKMVEQINILENRYTRQIVLKLSVFYVIIISRNYKLKVRFSSMEFGWINVFGTIIVVTMLIPNIIYGIKNKSVENKYKNNLVNVLEQIGRYVSLMLTIFPIGISGFKSAGYMLVYLIANVILLLLYLIIWICYFKSKSLLKTITLAIIPTIIFFVGILSKSEKRPLSSAIPSSIP